MCFSTRIIHLKSLIFFTKEAFPVALKVLIALWGESEEIYIDNSATYIVIKGELEFRQALATEEFQKLIFFQLTEPHNWLAHRALNFGGLCKTANKSMKGHLYCSIRETKLKNDDFATILTQRRSHFKFKSLSICFKWCQWCLSPHNRTFYIR